MGSPRAVYSVAYVQPKGSIVGSYPVFSVWVVIVIVFVLLDKGHKAEKLQKECFFYCTGSAKTAEFELLNDYSQYNKNLKLATSE